MQARSEGGLIDSEVTAVAVIPYLRPASAVEMIVTALVSARIARRKSTSSVSSMAISPC
jgi:hypothetical protein